MTGPFKCEFADFSPGEVSAITDIHPDTLRTWRKRGALESRGGARARFTAFEVGSLLIRRDLIALSKSPVESRTAGDLHAPRVVFAALAEGGVCEIRGTSTQVEAVRQEADSSSLYTQVTGFDRRPELLLVAFEDGALEARFALRTEVDLSGIRRGFFINAIELGAVFGSRSPRPLLVVTCDIAAGAGGDIVTARI